MDVFPIHHGALLGHFCKTLRSDGGPITSTPGPKPRSHQRRVRVVRDRGFDEEAAVLLHGRSVSADRRLSVRCMAPSADRVSVSDSVQEFAWTYDGNASAEFYRKVLLVACDQIVGACGHSHLEERLVVRIW